MAVTQLDVARRLRVAREAVGLTQGDVAVALGVARTAMVQLERGSRAVSALELAKLANLYGRDPRTFVDEVSPQRSADAYLKTLAGLKKSAPDDAVQASLRFGRELTNLERIVGIDRRVATSVNYSLAPPRTRYEAVQQGTDVALQERHRFGIGDMPIPDAGEFLEQQGVRTAEFELPADVSGLMIIDHEIGPFIVVNRNDSPPRRQFAFAHEYAHVILDSTIGEFTSCYSKQDDLLEVRANAFASALLLPEGGIRRYLSAVGKEGTGRLFVETQLAEKPTVVEDRDVRARTIRLHDVVLLSRYFGVSRQVVLYRLRNLGALKESELTSLFAQEQHGIAEKLDLLFGDEQPLQYQERKRFAARFLGLALEAAARRAISTDKLNDLLELVSGAQSGAAAWEELLPAVAGTMRT